MTNFKRDTREIMKGLNKSTRTVVEERILEVRDLGSHDLCFKCTKGRKREEVVALCLDPENRTVTTV